MAGATTQERVRAGAPPGRRGAAVFRRASPFLLLRHPALLAAVAVGSLLLAVAAAAYPLFMSATTSELVRSAVRFPSVTRYGAGITFTFRNLPLAPVRLETGLTAPTPDGPSAAFRELAAGSPILGRPVEAIVGDRMDVTFEGAAEPQDGRLFSATGALDEVEHVAGTDGDGAWLPDLIADQLGVHPGDTVQITNPEGGATVSIGVDGIYRAVYSTPPDGYWLPWAPDFRLQCLDCGPPPQPILVDRDQLLALERDLGEMTATVQWEAPISRDSISLDEARGLDAYQQRVQERMTVPDGDLSDVFACCRRYFYRPLSPEVPFGVTVSRFASSIGFVVDQAEKRIVAVEGPARVLEVAGVAVAIVVVAAAGAFSVRARRVEAAWLFARGRSATYVGGKTAIETLLPCVVGGILGFCVAVAAVLALGPDGPVGRSAYADAALATTLAVLGAVALTSVVAARTFLRVVDPHGRRFARLLALVPWEIGVAALALVALQRLREGGAFVTDERLDVIRPSLTLVAFPFLLLAGFALLAARVSQFGVAWLRRPTAGAPPAPYMAVRRLAGGGTFIMLLVGGAGLCLGTFLHAQIVSRSLEASVEAKAEVFVGSDVSAQVISTASVPEDFPYPATRVVQVGEGTRLPSGRPLDLLAIDPANFADAAYWSPAFGDASLEDLTDRLASREGDLPVILAAGGDLPVHEIGIGTASVPVRVVGRPSAFPGLYSKNPLLVVDEQLLLDHLDLPYNPLARIGSELWARGDTAGIQAAFAAMDSPPFIVLTAEAVQDIPHVAAAIDTFAIVNALGAVAALLAFVGMVMYLQARQRSQVVSYALSTRMGMNHGQHRRALVIELGAMMGIALAVAGVLAFVAARFTVPRLDPITAIPPAPLFVLPLSIGVASLVGTAALVWLGAALTNRRARRVDLGEVMRVAE